jgi:hypothetical protein
MSIITYNEDKIVSLCVVAAILGGQAWKKLLDALKRNISKDTMGMIQTNLRLFYHKFLGIDVV